LLNSNGIRPLSVDFEDSGTVDALKNLYREICLEYDAPHINWWVTHERIERIIGTELHVGVSGPTNIVNEARWLIHRLSRLENILLNDSNKEINGEFRGNTNTQQFFAHDGPRGEVHIISLARTLFGACCEAFSVIKCNRICKCGQRPTNKEEQYKMARIYKDSCHAAVWTSSHAQFIHDIVQYGISHSYPGIQNVPSELSELDMSDLYSRRWSWSISNTNDSTSLLSLMTRCTNPGSRGWDKIIYGLLDKNIGTKRICSNALAVSISGLHSSLHPAVRMHWKLRMYLVMHLSEKEIFNSVGSLCNNPIAFKELIRRFVSTTTSSSYASNLSLMHVEHPVSFLQACPLRLPPGGLECSSNAFVKTGERIVDLKGSYVLIDLINESFLELNNKFPVVNVVEDCQFLSLQWKSGYLGALAVTLLVDVVFNLVHACDFRKGHCFNSSQSSSYDCGRQFVDICFPF
jgi:hypothetical protein